MTTIEQIKSALLAHIAEAEAATPGPWDTVESQGDYFGKTLIGLDDTYEDWREDVAFIAHARTMSPAACKCLLLAIEGLAKVAYVKEDAGQPDHSFVGRTAAFALESIRLEWHNLTTK